MAFVTSYDPFDRSILGGLPHHMRRALVEESFDVTCIGPLKGSIPARLRTNAKRLFDSNYSRERSRALINSYAGEIARKLKGLKPDIIFSPATHGSQPIAHLETDIPIVIWTDSSFASARHPHPRLRKLRQESVRDGLENEAAALARCAIVIYASEREARAAIDHHDLDPKKVRVAPFGGNIESPITEASARSLVANRSDKDHTFLFVGKHWENKGGPFAISVVEEMNRRGLNSRLVVVGTQPTGPVPNFVETFGHLDKNDAPDRATLESLYAKAHVLILPTKAEGFGMVFCEANAFAVPCLAPTVGGVSSVIRDGVNGYTFPQDASPNDYADRAEALLSDRAGYEALAMSSFEQARSRLNWTTSARAVKQMIKEIL